MRRVALCVGVDVYDDPNINNLGCASHDAEETAFTLRQLGFEAVRMTQGVSADAIHGQLSQLGCGLQPGDVFVFFFAGHGTTHRPPGGAADQLFLLPRASAAELAHGALISPGQLSWHWLRTMTDSWRGVQRLFVFDACRLPLQALPGNQRNPGAPPAEPARFEGGGVFRDLKPMRAAASPQAAPNCAVIHSCDDGQAAEELPAYPGGGHGVFTAALIEVLQQAAREGHAVATDAPFGQLVHQRMQQLARQHGAKGPVQQPLLVGSAVQLLMARAAPAAPAAHAETRQPLGAIELDDRLWKLACVRARSQGVQAYEAYIEQAPAGARHIDEALTSIEALHDRAQALALAEAKASLAKQAEQAAREARRPGRVFREAPYAPEMVVIPAGRFLMGSPDNELERFSDEGPQHAVTLAQPFAMGHYPVTFDEYEAYCQASGQPLPDDRGWGRARRPVINVSWHDAQGYLAWLNAQLKLEGPSGCYRLPSEAEWEYAARAGSRSAFWWGDAIDTSRANYDGNHTYNGGAKGEYRHQTTPVNQFKANPFGLHDVHGNVWEWVQDHWHGSYADAPVDGSVWMAGGDEARRVLRGGSWNYVPRILRAANRISYSPDFRYYITGFRIARTF